jgi:hypothetical protein
MRRLLATLLLGWVLALASAVPALAVDGDPDNPPDSCFETNADGDLPTCTFSGGTWHRSYPTADDGDGSSGGFALLVVLAFTAAIGFTVYKVSMARNMARKAGMDPGQATAVTLLTDDGLEATYLASNLRQPSAAGQPADSGAVGRTVSERLAELESLREQGLVTQVEYDERRAAILGSL